MVQCNQKSRFFCLSILFIVSPISCFHSTYPSFQTRRNVLRHNIDSLNEKAHRKATTFSNSRLFSSDPSSENVDMMRQLLEASWNVDSMGIVPSTPESAAEAAATAIENARDNNNMNMLLIDLLLPTYDITEGENLYDEVLAAEFCISLANAIKQESDIGKTAVLVKNGKSLRTVDRVLNMKEQRMLEEEEEEEEYEEDFEDTEIQDLDGIGASTEIDEFNDFEDIGSISSFSDDFSSNENSEFDGKADDSNQSKADTEEFSDFNDLGSISSFPNDFPSENISSKMNTEFDTGSTDDVDSFRQQLMSSWNEDESVADESPDMTASSNEEKSPEVENPRKKKKTRKKKKIKSIESLPKCYRLGSLLGDKLISSGPDMFDNVVEAVDENAVPSQNKNDEDTLIILSSASQEEMIAIRRLIAKFKSTKTFIFVNCKLNPLPREMIRATTVYSILPLIAKPIVSEANILAKDQDPSSQSEPTKVVLMRRFPRDWELFVDIDGSGFEMVDSVPASAVGAKGPSMEWISSCVKNFMKLKFDGR